MLAPTKESRPDERLRTSGEYDRPALSGLRDLTLAGDKACGRGDGPREGAGAALLDAADKDVKTGGSEPAAGTLGWAV